MFAKPVSCLVVAISLGLLMATPQLARSQMKLQLTGDELTDDDGPFTVTGYRDDLASTGVELGFRPNTSLAAAKERAAEYISKNAGHQGVRAEIESANHKKMTISIPDQAKKKGLKEEKKVEPIPPYTPPPPVDFRPGLEKPYNPPDKAKPESAPKLTMAEFVGKYAKERGYNGYTRLELKKDMTGTVQLAGQGASKRSYDINWKLNDNQLVEITVGKIVSSETYEGDFWEQYDSSTFFGWQWKLDGATLKPVFTGGPKKGQVLDNTSEQLDKK
jgi:hypothetical protein